MIDPVPSPELEEPSSESFGGAGEGVGEVLVFEFGTVTTMTVGEPFDPVLWMLVT